MRFGFALCLLLIASAASAKEVTITLSDDEQRVFAQLLDQAVRAQGLNSAEPAIYLMKKMQAAAAPAPQPKDK